MTDPVEAVRRSVQKHLAVTDAAVERESGVGGFAKPSAIIVQQGRARPVTSCFTCALAVFDCQITFRSDTVPLISSWSVLLGEPLFALTGHFLEAGRQRAQIHRGSMRDGAGGRAQRGVRGGSVRIGNDRGRAGPV